MRLAGSIFVIILGKNDGFRHLCYLGSKDNAKHLRNSEILYKTLNCKKEFYLLNGIPHDLANTQQDKELFTKTIMDILIKYEK